MVKRKKKEQGVSPNALVGIIAVVGILVVFTSYIVGFQAGSMNVGGAVVQAGDDPVEAQGAEQADEPAPEPEEEAPPPPSPTADVSLDGAPVKGDADAPVTIIEFSDFECPFCGRHYQQTLPQIEEEYIETGKVKYAYRDFPLSFHPNAQKAAEAGKCAAAQSDELFWELHDKMFENQKQLNEENYKAWAAEAGADVEAFNECLDSGEMADEVRADFNAGRQAGVKGTPGFFVNGKLISGAQPYEVFKQAIEAELA